MRAWLRISLLACAIAVAAGFVPVALAGAAEPLEIRWEQLIPQSLQQTAKSKLMAKLLPQRHAMDRANVSMSPQSDLVTAYDGQRVRITGFVVPFNNELPPYKRLLLIPFSGACVKFPPPRNQAILITHEKGFHLDSFVDPVAVTGTMSVAPTQTDIAKIGYRIAAETIEPQD
jgi:hypothetical protein